MDLQCAREAIEIFLQNQGAAPGFEHRAKRVKPIPFDFSSSLPKPLKEWVSAQESRLDSILDETLIDNSNSMKLAAAACQNLAAFGFLLGNCNAIGKALAILAGIEDLPECRDQRRSLDGRSRGELSRENLLRAGHYFEMAGERAKADYWFGKTKASFAKSPL